MYQRKEIYSHKEYKVINGKEFQFSLAGFEHKVCGISLIRETKRNGVSSYQPTTQSLVIASSIVVGSLAVLIYYQKN